MYFEVYAGVWVLTIQPAQVQVRLRAEENTTVCCVSDTYLCGM
jgi:hypothetical protein